jgi:RTX calcium-binding nonapeptide repeat (4 copies)
VRRLLLVLTTMAVAVALASGVAMAEAWTGDDGPNNHQGTADNDDLNGRGGNDLLVGMGGADQVNGGDDNDDLYGGRRDAGQVTGTNSVVGGHGGDSIWGDDGADDLRGGWGTDTIYDALENDSAVDDVYGGEGADTVYVVSDPAHRDNVSCGPDNDEAHVDASDVVDSDCEVVGKTVFGTQGDDTISGFNGGDEIQGDAGNDQIQGGGGDDQLWGGSEQYPTVAGNDQVYGDTGADTIIGSAGADMLHGGDGDDMFRDGPEDDAQTDEIWAGAGDDEVNTSNIPAARDTVDCGNGLLDTVEADALDEVAANCETVERVGAPPDVRSGDVSTLAFNCGLNAEDPHKSTNSDGREVMVAKGHLTCETDSNRIYLVTELWRWRWNGWQFLDSRINGVDQRRKAAHTNLRWRCNSNDDFWFKNYTHGVVSNNGNHKEYFQANISNRKWRC